MNSHVKDEDFWKTKSRATFRAKVRALLPTNKDEILVIQEVLSNIPENSKVLELGVAPGSMASTYQSIRKDLIYEEIDIRQTGLSITKQSLSDSRDSLHQHENKYDLVCSHGLVDLYEDFEQVIREHIKFAKDGGMIFITIPNYSSWPLRPLLKNFSKKTIEGHNFSCMSLESLKRSYQNEEVREISLDSYGGAIIPNSDVNKNFSGLLFKRFAQAWNLTISVLRFISLGQINLRLWDSNLYLLIQKK